MTRRHRPEIKTLNLPQVGRQSTLAAIWTS